MKNKNAKRNLYIYTTVYNNAGRVDACIKSLMPLKPKKFFVIDNYSTDGTFEVLKKHKNVVVKQQKSTKGGGRGIAMNMALAQAKDNDVMGYIDLDMVYKKPYLRLMKRAFTKIKHDEISFMLQMATAKTNRKLPWNTLNDCEDVERLARAKCSHIKIVDYDMLDEISAAIAKDSKLRNKNSYFENDPGAGSSAYSREKRYAGNKINLLYRMIRQIVETQRSGSYKSFKSFYAIVKHKTLGNKIAFWIGYNVANLMGTYSYDSKLNNYEFVKDRTPVE